MENFSIQTSFENGFLWSKPSFSMRSQSFGCQSTCTTLSQASQQSPLCVDIENEENDLFRLPLGSPIHETDFDDSLPDDSTYAHNGSFNEDEEDDFQDLLQQNYETEFICEEGHTKINEERKRKSHQFSKHKGRKAFSEGWEIIKNLFFRFLGGSAAITMMNYDMNQHEFLWKIGIQEFKKIVKREAKKMLKNNVAKFPEECRSHEEFEVIVWELLRKLYFKFLNENSEFVIRGLRNVSEDMKELMLEIIVSMSR